MTSLQIEAIREMSWKLKMKSCQQALDQRVDVSKKVAKATTKNNHSS
jgi:hypothetical protein